MAELPLLTVLACTYNRAHDLAEMLASILAQEEVDPASYEIVVVDNNSSDGTRELVARLIDAGAKNLRYLFEPRQGKAFALNQGIESARGSYYSVIDDDLIVPPIYVSNLLDAIARHPNAAALGGKVLPIFEVPPPRWLTAEHWSPIAMADWGEDSFFVDSTRPLCFMSATLKREDVFAVGGYRTELGVKGRQVIGGTEDADLLMRLWRSGRRGVYVPHLHLCHKVAADRLTRGYFRRWHFGHGRSLAVQRDEEVERSRWHLAGIPGHIYRSAAEEVVRWVLAMGRLDRDGAFRAETRLSFFAGFARQRLFDANVRRASGVRPH